MYVGVSDSCFQEMASIALETYLNQFRPGFAPDPTGGAYSATPDPQEPHLRLRTWLPPPETPANINPSYDLARERPQRPQPRNLRRMATAGSGHSTTPGQTVSSELVFLVQLWRR